MKTMTQLLGRFAIVVCVFGLAAGCSSAPDDMPDVAEVTGTVTFNGEPLTDARITFQPESGRPSSATTGSNGEYTLMYNENTPGAKIGKHKVSISKANDTKDAAGEIIKSEEIVPAKYNLETTLEETVEDQANEINFQLES
ncbi:carboxypeptidase-like regulatory domain-containing protein [Thalassoroseus pseudoceratinae]|uniref:carboxypeptidase-like regulatory domain-containing protein n=1 Tax=Thalassoroseus pseudoceratinae TaxID=2713176 RepID=UPI00141FDEE3|nr:carboxypeptidase-like regulatory domain-containing protein [Thalassoroseus pseudoceratinae]